MDIKEKLVRSCIKKASENVLQVDNLSELWESEEYTIEDIMKYRYIMECDTGSVYIVI
jgi:hypothetical protein